MELDREGPQVRIVDALAGAVVGVDEAYLPHLHAVAVHGVAVVLAGDVGADAVQVPDGLVDAPVPVFQLVGAAPRRQGRQLVAQADAEQGHPAQKLFDLLNLAGVFRRVSGAVGEHDPVRLGRQHLLRAGVRGQDGDGAAALLQLPDDIPLGAVVQQADAEPLLPRRRVDGGLFAGHRLHHAGDGVSPHRRQVCRDFLTDGRIHDAVLPDDPGQLPGVHPPEPRHAPIPQKSVQVSLAAEIGRLLAPLPHHVAPDATRAFKILRNDPIIADQRIGLHHDLSSIAGIRQCLQIAAHAGGEHQLAHGVRRTSEPEALKHLAVL